MGDNVRVAVRVRPFNDREKDRNAKVIVAMDGPTTTLTNPENGEEKKFTFDFSYWSHDGFQVDGNGYSQPSNDKYADQVKVFNDLGIDVLNNAWEGYNVSLFAYGQTGSGKSYSMVGYDANKGIIPMVCDEIFKRIEKTQSDDHRFQVEASMMEIYMERIRDLFNPKNNPQGGLKVRENPKTGPYVEGLAKLLVKNYVEVEALMEDGSKARTVASTNMNATSSRAHTLFTLVFTQTKVDRTTMKATDKVAKINLVDLAGSERADSTGAAGDRLKEGSAINKSLSALGNCISALAEMSKKGSKKPYVPYRDSVLTWLLKESLGGNAKTIMIAALSPADINFDETLSTLRYADRAKQIKNNAIVNEDPNEKLVRDLRNEIEDLKKMLASQGGGGGVQFEGGKDDEDAEKEKLRIQLEESQKLIAELNMTYEEKLKHTENIQQSRQAALVDMGLKVTDEMRTTPHFVNLNEDPLMSGTLFYLLKQGVTKIGRKDADEPPDIQLQGLNVAKKHGEVSNDNNKCQIFHKGGITYVNGQQLTQPKVLQHNDRIIFGNNHVFRYNDPIEAARRRDERNKWIEEHPDEPPPPPELVTWEFAQRELLEAKGQLPSVENSEARMKELKDLEDKMNKEKEAQAKELEEKKKEFEKKQDELKKKMMKKEKEMKRKLKGANQEELDKKMAELEMQMSKEKDQVSSEFTQKQREMESKQRELDLALARQREKESYTRSLDLLEETLLKVIPMVNDANVISYELEKFVDFSVKIMQKASKVSEGSMTQVFVKVHNEVLETATMWKYEKFIDRFYHMQETYNEFMEYETIPFVPVEDDPFYDAPEDMIIGVSNIYLESLAYLIDIDETTPIIDYKGKEEGELLIKISIEEVNGQPFSDLRENFEGLEDLMGKSIGLKLQIAGARGIRDTMAQNNFVKFGFWDHTQVYETPRTTKHTINPQFDFVADLKVDAVSNDFINYIYTEPISFELWGRSMIVTEDMIRDFTPADDGALPQRTMTKALTGRRRTTMGRGMTRRQQTNATDASDSSHTTAPLNDDRVHELEDALESQRIEYERQAELLANAKSEIEKKDQQIKEELSKANPNYEKLVQEREEMIRKEKEVEVKHMKDEMKQKEEKLAKLQSELSKKQAELEAAKSQGGSKACIIL
eukprot:GFYU01001468.1.p1 GENE.GFYU01001468.1~~GFYU01001468.1.p1  ORF type:complete len:1151 (+),score=495.77 GFYU01001468.1:265-3717(+)